MNDFLRYEEDAMVMGIEVTVNRLSLVVLDAAEGLKPCYQDHVLFDRDVPEYNTRNGVCSFPSPRVDDPSAIQLFPGALLLKALDMILDHAARSMAFSFSSVKAISVTGDPDIVFLLAEGATLQLHDLSANLSLARQLKAPHFFTSHMHPTCLDLSGKYEQLRLQAVLRHSNVPAPVLGSFLLQIAKLGAPDSLSMYLATESWNNTAHIVSAAGLISTLLIGSLTDLTKQELKIIGIDISNPELPPLLSAASRGDVLGLSKKLGLLDPNPRQDSSLRFISPWVVERYKFNTDCVVTQVQLRSLAAFKSFLPGPFDIGIGFTERFDDLISPNSDPCRFPEFDQARQHVRNRIGKGRCWVASRLALAIPPGGSLGLDDKAFCLPQQSNDPSYLNCENGVFVKRFQDSRIESRCLLEGQALTFRTALERAGVHHKLRHRIFCWGRGVGDTALTTILSQVFGADIVAARDDVDASALQDWHLSGPLYHQAGPESAATEIRGLGMIEAADTRLRRATLGAAYQAFVAWQSLQTGTQVDFEEAILAAMHGTLRIRTNDTDDGLDCCSDSPSSIDGSLCDSPATSIYPTVSSPRDTPFPCFCPSGTLTSAESKLGSYPEQAAAAVEADCGLSTTGIMSEEARKKDEEERGLVRLAPADPQMYVFYEALLPEFKRLQRVVAAATTQSW